MASPKKEAEYKEYRRVLKGRYRTDFGTDRPNKTILKMAQMITDRMGHIVTGQDPDYYGIAAFVTEEMAEVALKMKVRKPKTVEEIAKLTGKTVERTQELLDQMAYIGVVEYDHERPDNKRQYKVGTFVPGSAEMLNIHPDWYKDHPELAEMFDLETFLPLAGLTQMLPPGGAGTGMHVVPVEKAIESCSTSIDIEHISHWLDKYDKFAAGVCSCRAEHEERGDGCVDDKYGWCIAVGDFAEYCHETNKPGSGYISKEKVMEILVQAEKNGFVHNITNIDGKDKIFGICNCDPKICNALRIAMLFNTPNLEASAYRAHVDPQNCVACGQCVEVCPAGAVKLGQKLKKKDGTEQTYPVADDPFDHFWPKSRWDPDYRDTSRTDCYDSGTAPCKTACPAHIAVQGYLQLAKEGRYEEALELIKKENPFPAVCGRVCNHRCEDACTRGTIDQAVAIDEVKKFIAQRDLYAETRFVPEIVKPTSIWDLDPYEEKIAIIGAGPAGLSCAYYLATVGYKPTIFEKNAEPGGMMTYGIPSFKLDKKVVNAEIDILRDLGVEIKTGVTVGKDVTIQELRDQGYKAFYIAIGCQGSRKAGVPDEDAADIISAIDHLAKVHSDKDYKTGKKVIVIGGGNVAIDAARTSGRIGGEDVEMYCLEQRDEMPASDEEVAEAEGENIRINCGWGPKEFLKDDDGKVKGVVFKKCTAVKDAAGKFSPQYDEDDTITVDADYVITSIGQCIDWNGMLDGEKMDYVHGNYPKADSFTYQTSVEDIFVGGDVYHGPKFVIDAIGEGHEAAESIHRFVRPSACSLTQGRDHRHYIEFNKDDISIDSYDNSKRQKPELISGIDAATTFEEYTGCFTEDQVKIETSRCLSCGASIVDLNKCLGCGLCTTRCKFDAIHLTRDVPEASNMVPCEDRIKTMLPYAAKRADVQFLHSTSYPTPGKCSGSRIHG